MLDILITLLFFINLTLLDLIIVKLQLVKQQENWLFQVDFREKVWKIIFCILYLKCLELHSLRIYEKAQKWLILDFKPFFGTETQVFSPITILKVSHF